MPKLKKIKRAARLRYKTNPVQSVTDRRSAPRKELKANAAIKIRLQDGSLYSQCKGEVVNISATGMLLKSVSGTGRGMPFEPFFLEIYLAQPKQKLSELTARPVRFTQPSNKYGIGVKFVDIPKDDDAFLKMLTEATAKYKSQ